jgi:hypothetical protein
MVQRPLAALARSMTPGQSLKEFSLDYRLLRLVGEGRFILFADSEGFLIDPRAAPHFTTMEMRKTLC